MALWPLLQPFSFGQTADDTAVGSMAEKSDAVATDTLQELRTPFFNGIDLYIDYGKLLLLPTEFESKAEAGISFRFLDHYLAAVEFGMAVIDPLKAFDNVVYYTVEGRYFRFGMDYYLPVDKKNFLYLGVRYGMSSFEDRGLLRVESDVWEDYELAFGDEGLTASWYELILGSETQLTIGKEEGRIFIQRFFLGWKFRFRIQGTFVNRESLRVYTIPGYGRTFDKTIPALNFYIKYRFGR